MMSMILLLILVEMLMSPVVVFSHGVGVDEVGDGSLLLLTICFVMLSIGVYGSLCES